MFTIPNAKEKVNIFPGSGPPRPGKITVYIPCKIFYK
jgi:hypothetical protein